MEFELIELTRIPRKSSIIGNYNALAKVKIPDIQEINPSRESMEKKMDFPCIKLKPIVRKVNTLLTSYDIDLKHPKAG